MAERVDCVVIGGGQAGLSASHQLTQAGVEHVLLERSRIGQSWASRWDSFCLVTPNWTAQLPGHPYDGDDPDGYLPRDDIVRYLESYARTFGAPLRDGAEATALEPTSDGAFEIRTSAGDLRAKNVAVATGAYQRPHRPAGSTMLPGDLPLLDLEEYRNPEALPSGPVLIVGSGQSGCQLAEELVEAGREVLLACGRAPWAPRRLGGRDFVWWAAETGFLDQPVGSLATPAARLAANVQGTGHGGGHDLSYRTLRAMGVTLLGHFLGAEGRSARFAPDLGETVAWGDERYVQFTDLIRKLVAERGIPLPDIPEPPPFDGAAPESIDLSGFGAVIFTGGFRPDYGAWMRTPGAFDELGFPIHGDCESSPFPGLFFVGVHFLRKRKSSLLYGVGEDAAIVANGIAARLGGHGEGRILALNPLSDKVTITRPQANHMTRPGVVPPVRKVRAGALASLVGLLLALVPGAARGAPATAAFVPWVQFHGDAASRGLNPFENTVGLNNVSSLSLKWIGDGATTGEDLVFRSSPVVSKGLVYFGTDAGQVLAFRATGCGNSSCEPVWRADVLQGVYNTPSIFQDTLFVGSASPEGRFYAFEAGGCGAFCTMKWSTPLQVGEPSSKVSNGVVYVGSDGAAPGLYAFDARGCGQTTCSPLWVGTTASAVESSPAISGGFVYVAGQDGYLDVFQADGCGSSTCDPVWRGKLGAPSFGSSPAVSDGLVFQPSFNGRLNVFVAAGCGGAVCQPLWKGDLENYGESSPAVAKGWVFIGHHEGWLAAFKASGCGQQLCQPNWFGMPAGPVAENDSSPMVANGVVYIGSMANRVYAFKAAGCGSTSCHTLWEFITQDPIVNSTPVMDGGTLFVSGSNFGSVPQLYVFRAFGT